MSRYDHLNALRLLVLFGMLCLVPATSIYSQEKPLIFPIPQETEIFDGFFTLSESTSILIPDNASENDLALARMLVRELSDKYGLALNITTTGIIPDTGKVIIMGSIDNPLVKESCLNSNTVVTADSPGKEGYVLLVEENRILLAGWDEQGAFYGLQSLRQLLTANIDLKIPQMRVRDWPRMPFRGIRLYIPGPENTPFFKRFLKDFMALYKFNKVIIEVNCMRLDRHPEVNAGWIEFSKYMKYTRTTELQGAQGQTKNSGHQDAGDGFIIEKEDVREIVRVANQNYIEVIPEIPSLSHGYYLLTRHPELAEYEEDLWPDTYCPSNPKSYELMFDVLDEYIEVINPKMIHLGHDEWRGAPLNVCPRCTGLDYSDLFASDINKLHSYLAEKDIQVAIWGDFLLESIRGKGPHNRISETGFEYQTPGGLRPEVVRESIPKDILLFNWFWDDQAKGRELHEFGFAQLYGNFKPNISNWDARIKDVKVIGGAPSAWASTNEFTFGKDLLKDFLGCANLMWSSHTLEETDLAPYIWELVPSVRRNFMGMNLPSDDGDLVMPIDISQHFNFPLDSELFGINLSTLKSDKINRGNKRFELQTPTEITTNGAVALGVIGKGENPLPGQINGIIIDEDVSSLIFLHASARPASNQKSYFNIYNTFDSSDLLGWYEIIYEDGFIEIVPIKYGVNILEWNPGESISLDPRRGDTGSPQNTYAYEADVIDCSQDMEANPIRFHAFEWVNKRFGKKIVEVNLTSSLNYQSLQPVYSRETTELMTSNAVILIGLSKVQRREPNTKF